MRNEVDTMFTKMFTKLKERIKHFDYKIKKIMKSGFYVSFYICLFATLLLAVYALLYTSPNLYYIGLSLLKTGFMFFVYFIICGFAFDTIQKQLI